MNQTPLSLQQAAPGMRLGVDVHDAHGAVLLVAGTELTESLLTALQRRGIVWISVLEVELLSEAEREVRREAVAARLAHLFRRGGKSEADRQLFDSVRDYRMETLG
jgi:hypothetical protein